MTTTESNRQWFVVQCKNGANGPRMAYPITMNGGQPDQSDVSNAQAQAQAIVNSGARCADCGPDCQIYNLAYADLGDSDIAPKYTRAGLG